MSIPDTTRLAIRNQTLMLAQAESDDEARVWLLLLLESFRDHVREKSVSAGMPASAFDAISEQVHIESWARVTERAASEVECGEVKTTMLLAAARARRLVGK